MEEYKYSIQKNGEPSRTRTRQQFEGVLNNEIENLRIIDIVEKDPNHRNDDGQYFDTGRSLVATRHRDGQWNIIKKDPNNPGGYQEKVPANNINEHIRMFFSEDAYRNPRRAAGGRRRKSKTHRKRQSRRRRSHRQARR